jgi:ABC-type uncharacterized transport system involved in gliding motility auxiliary subunit
VDLMQALGTLLGVVGAVLLLSSSTVGLYFFGAKSPLALGPLITGALCLAGWFALRFDAIREKLSERAGLFYSLTAAYAVVLMGMLVAVNFLAMRSRATVDMSAAQVHSLAPQSVHFVQQLQIPVRLTAFYPQGTPELQILEDFLDRYRRHSTLLEFRSFDPDRDIQAVQGYRISDEGPRVVVETDWLTPSQRRESRFKIDVTALNHEETITNALIKAVRADKKTVCFLQGHGEPSLKSDEADGLSLLAKDLEGEGYDVRPINLVESQWVPEACAALVVVGPQQAPLGPEMAALKKYLDEKRHLAILLQPKTAHGFDGLLGRFGLQANNDVVIDVSDFGNLFGSGPDTAVAISYAEHALTKGFSGAATVFPGACSLSVNPGGEGKVTELVRTSDRAWGETALDAEGGEIQWDEGEVKGPITLLAVVEPKKPFVEKGQAPKPAEKGPRLVVGCDADFVGNQHRGLSANRNLFLNAMGWLTEQEEKIAIRPRSRGSSRPTYTPAQKQGIAFFILYGMPVVLLSLGLGLWLVRRQR